MTPSSRRPARRGTTGSPGGSLWRSGAADRGQKSSSRMPFALAALMSSACPSSVASDGSTPSDAAAAGVDKCCTACDSLPGEGSAGGVGTRFSNSAAGALMEPDESALSPSVGGGASLGCSWPPLGACCGRGRGNSPSCGCGDGGACGAERDSPPKPRSTSWGSRSAHASRLQ